MVMWLRIGIIDADLLDKGTRHPNLALMKISGYYKEKGSAVSLITSYNHIDEFDHIYISKVFTFTKIPQRIIDLPNVTIGGTGFFEDGGQDLPPEIEHHMPDYTLYDDYVQHQIEAGYDPKRFSDYQDYSIGFTTRGCFRKCAFCVNKKYDRAVKHSPISEFYDSTRPFIYLWDDNFFAYSGWEEIFDELEGTGKPFQFRQGLDLRLMTDKKARRLSQSKYHGDIIFAFDHIEDRDLIERKLKIWKRYSNKTTKLYVLCAYDSQDIQDVINTFERIKILMSYGCLPYIMRYESYKTSEFKDLYTQLARWCNQPQFFKKKSFRQFCEANQAVHKGKDTFCASYQCLLEMDKKYPEVTKKYFDLRFDQENKYILSYGFGRKYPHKRDCVTCSEEQATWSDAYLGNIERKEVLRRYLSGEMDLQCLAHVDSTCKNAINVDSLSQWFVDLLLSSSWEDIIEVITERINPETIKTSNIPQISNIDDVIFGVPHFIYEGELSLSYENMGYYLRRKANPPDLDDVVANRKYGENQSKLAAQLDLVVISKEGQSFVIQESILGTVYSKLDRDKQLSIARKLMFRIPIIQEIFCDSLSREISLEDYLIPLSKTTQTRRGSTIKALVNFIDSDDNALISKLHKNMNIYDKEK